MKLVEPQEARAQRMSDMDGRKGVQTQPKQERQQDLFQNQYRREMAGARPATGHGTNVGRDERTVSFVAGAIAALMGLSRGSMQGLIGVGVGSMLIYRGVTGRCPAYSTLGLNTAQSDTGEAEENPEYGIQVATAFTINKPADELYRFWRKLDNLPQFMEHLESVQVIDDRKSHWVAKAPRIVGGKVEWHAQITRDDPNELIAWQSLPGSTIETAGQVRFAKALGDRGTEVHVWMNYLPPGGRLGHWITSMLGENPRRVVREELHNFKRLMEVGEILSINGQPHGTCTGQGKPYSETQWKPLFM
jgi:uncharacterized membrane protein